MEVESKRDGGGAAKPKPKMAETWPEMIRAWPKRTLCIVSNEFCERYSFYGMRTVLFLYLLNVLKYSHSSATVLFNGFTVVCYFTPLIGSILADGYIGKFKTIFFVSIVYAVGQVILAISSTQDSSSSLHPFLDLLGLAVIGFGTGGIKPCVSSFGGDQFEPHQERMLSLFFSVFYFSINAGAMISTFVTPIFRATPCMNQDSCYPLAFGVPAALMILATGLFMAGSFSYVKPPPKENIFAVVLKVVKLAIRNKMRNSSRRHSHWLDYYFDTHRCVDDEKCRELQRSKRDPTACHQRTFVDDIKSLLRLLIMFLPVPIFWTLYDQQGSTWMLQSLQMDCRLWGDTVLLPDQMQTLNAILILAFIPIFQVVVYPLVSKCFKLTPLRKMIAGGLVAVVAFVVSALVQFKVNTTLPDLPPPGNGFVTLMNTFDDCILTVSANGHDEIAPFVLQPNTSLINDRTRQIRQLLEFPASKVTWNIGYNGSECSNPKGMNLPEKATYEVGDGGTFYLAMGPLGTIYSKASTLKPTDGTGEFSLGISLALADLEYTGNLALCRKNSVGTNAEHPCDPRNPDDFYGYERMDNSSEQNDFLGTQPYTTASGPSRKNASLYAFKSVKPGSWKLYYLLNTPKKIGQQTYSKEEVKVESAQVDLEIRAQGGVYLMVVTGTKADTRKHLFQAVQDNSFSILWQVPQIAIITAAEILFSITGLEFAYSQAAPSMKSLVQACWLLTTSIGDSIIVIVALVNISNMAYQLLFYAALMLGVTAIFALMSIFYYEYNYYTGDDGKGEFDNAGMEMDAEEWAVDSPKDAPLRRRTTATSGHTDAADGNLTSSNNHNDYGSGKRSGAGDMATFSDTGKEDWQHHF